MWLSGSKMGMDGYENTLCNIALWLTDKQAHTQLPPQLQNICKCTETLTPPTHTETDRDTLRHMHFP